ncbi:MAG TPA: TIGR04086 family membrane protein [Ruminococcus sp.]|nr:TIGR04086 family membrane protein [Ruminococcus sp.]
MISDLRSALWGALFGGAVTVLSCGVFAALVFFVLGSTQFLPFLSRAALWTGAFCGAYLSGKLRRRRGLLGGALSSAALFLMISLAQLPFGLLPEAKKLPLLLLFGAAGGVMGVNSKRPSWLRDQ